MGTPDFFRSRLELMIDLRHPLAVLSKHLPWDEIEASLSPLFLHKDRAGKRNEEADLFGSSVELAGAGISNAGRPRLMIRFPALSLCRNKGDSEASISSQGRRLRKKSSVPMAKSLSILLAA